MLRILSCLDRIQIYGLSNSMKNITQTEERKQPKIKPEMNGKRFTVHGGLLPAQSFVVKLLFIQSIQEAIRKERGIDAQH